MLVSGRVNGNRLVLFLCSFSTKSWFQKTFPRFACRCQCSQNSMPLDLLSTFLSHCWKIFQEYETFRLLDSDDLIKEIIFEVYWILRGPCVAHRFAPATPLQRHHIQRSDERLWGWMADPQSAKSWTQRMKLKINEIKWNRSADRHSDANAMLIGFRKWCEDSLAADADAFAGSIGSPCYLTAKPTQVDFFFCFKEIVRPFIWSRSLLPPSGGRYLQFDDQCLRQRRPVGPCFALLHRTFAEATSDLL